MHTPPPDPDLNTVEESPTPPSPTPLPKPPPDFSPALSLPISTPVSMYETVILGREAIARVFAKKDIEQFWSKHGEELRRLGVVGRVACGTPRRTRVAAFMSQLVLWFTFKSMKGEII